jgi:hypothetical protein
MRQDEHLPNSEEGTAAESRPRLLDARRKFLIGSFGLTTFAATLRSRPAFASGQGNWASWAQQQACSPNPSSPLTRNFPSSLHCDHFTGHTSNWGSWGSNWEHQTFSECGWTPPNGYGLSGSTTLVGCLTPSYSTSGSRHVYQTHNNTNLGCWLSVGFLCASVDGANFGYTVSEFGQACTSVLNTPSCSTQTISTWLCTALTSICTNGYQGSTGVSGGQGSCWGH